MWPWKLSRIHIRNGLSGNISVKTYFILISTSYFFLNWIRFSNCWLKWRLLVKFHYQFHHEFSNAGCSLKIWQGITYDFIQILMRWLFVRKLWSDHLIPISVQLKTFELGHKNFEIVTVKSYSSTYEINFEIRRGFTFMGQLRAKFAIKFWTDLLTIVHSF